MSSTCLRTVRRLFMASLPILTRTIRRLITARSPSAPGLSLVLRGAVAGGIATGTITAISTSTTTTISTETISILAIETRLTTGRGTPVEANGIIIHNIAAGRRMSTEEQLTNREDGRAYRRLNNDRPEAGPRIVRAV